MPRIPDQLLESVVYLYPSLDSAKAGKDAGGTGFVVLKPFDRIPGLGLLYIVTNKHVAARAPVLRLNRRDGGAPDCLEFDDVHWMYHAGPHDLAVLVGAANQNFHKFIPIMTNQLLTRQQAADLAIGIGDDVFMLGRFIGHEGRIHNEPTARLGNVSATARMMWNVEAQVDEESFAVEMRSKPGYSGSPTFIWNSVFNNHLTPSPRTPPNDKFSFMKLLGVNWGQIYEKRPLRDKDGKEIEGPHVTEASGMNGVVPAWHILSLLEQKDVLEMHKTFEDAEVAKDSASRSVIVASGAPEAPAAKDENPQHQADFTSLLRAAARKQTQDE